VATNRGRSGTTKVLLSTSPFLGHFHPLVPLVRALELAGHEVAVACPPSFHPTVQRAGFRVWSAGKDIDGERTRIREQLRAIPSAAERFELFAINEVVDLNARRFVSDLVEICLHWQPDVFVHEQWELGGAVAAEHMGLPHAVVMVTGTRTGHSLERSMGERLDRIRQSWGRSGDSGLQMLYRYLGFTFEPPTFQRFPGGSLPETVYPLRYVGVETSGDETRPVWLARLGNHPITYVTLGTVSNTVPGMLEAIIAGLREEPGTLIVTVGRDRDPEEFGPQPPNVHIERYIPQSLLMPHCDLVVAHGGHQTMMETLSWGIPMVLIPVEYDQTLNAARCAALWVSKSMKYREASPDTIRAAAREVLENPRYRQNARALQAEMESLPGVEYGVSLLEALVARCIPQPETGASHHTHADLAQ
jgi:UDP:flavonoid glycosyltransferase YjiC (YdhE family)